jgi:hypothetical protein
MAVAVVAVVVAVEVVAVAVMVTRTMDMVGVTMATAARAATDGKCLNGLCSQFSTLVPTIGTSELARCGLDAHYVPACSFFMLSATLPIYYGL